MSKNTQKHILLKTKTALLSKNSQKTVATSDLEPISGLISHQPYVVSEDSNFKGLWSQTLLKNTSCVSGSEVTTPLDLNNWYPKALWKFLFLNDCVDTESKLRQLSVTKSMVPKSISKIGTNWLFKMKFLSQPPTRHRQTIGRNPSTNPSIHRHYSLSTCQPGLLTYTPNHGFPGSVKQFSLFGASRFFLISL